MPDSAPDRVPPASRPALVLASTSRWRRQLLERLDTPFTAVAPDTDETARPGESAGRLATRLAHDKAAAVAARRPAALGIGADQLACRGTDLLGKPGTPEAAIAQLCASSGHEVTFLTAVALHGPAAGQVVGHLDVTRVLFRELERSEIERYVAREMPLDCAGSFRCEGLGISLFRRMESRDPTALIGLPLIWLAGALRRAGFKLP